MRRSRVRIPKAARALGDPARRDAPRGVALHYVGGPSPPDPPRCELLAYQRGSAWRNQHGLAIMWCCSARARLAEPIELVDRLGPGLVLAPNGITVRAPRVPAWFCSEGTSTAWLTMCVVLLVPCARLVGSSFRLSSPNGVTVRAPGVPAWFCVEKPARLGNHVVLLSACVTCRVLTVQVWPSPKGIVVLLLRDVCCWYWGYWVFMGCLRDVVLPR